MVIPGTESSNGTDVKDKPSIAKPPPGGQFVLQYAGGIMLLACISTLVSGNWNWVGRTWGAS